MAEPTSPLLLRRLRVLHEALDAAGFEHAVGGAIALAVHVREPRFTADIDLNVIADPADPEPLLACLPDEIVVLPRNALELRRDGQTRVIWPDPATPVDLFLPQHPVFHQLVADRSEQVDFLGAGIRVIGATDLAIFKALFDRSKDWVDIETLLESGRVDLAEATSWLAELLGPDDTRIPRLTTLAKEIGPGQPSGPMK